MLAGRDEVIGEGRQLGGRHSHRDVACSFVVRKIAGLRPGFAFDRGIDQLPDPRPESRETIVSRRRDEQPMLIFGQPQMQPLRPAAAYR